MTVVATSALILATKRAIDGSSGGEANPYSSIPVGKVLQQSLGLGGSDLRQCQVNQASLTKGDELAHKAQALAEDKDYQGAIDQYNQALDSYKKYPGLDCLQAISALTEKGKCEHTLGLVHNYENTLRTLVDVSEKGYNSRHQQVASCLENLGDFLCSENRPREALPFLQRAFDIRLKGAGMESGDTAYAMSQLAHCHLDLKNFKDADGLYIQAIAVYQKLDGNGFSQAQQIARENLANSYCWQDRYKDAMDCEMAVLSDLEKKNLGDSYYAANTLTSAAGTAERQDDLQKMHEFLNRAQKIALSLDKSEDAPKRAEIFGEIADAYSDDEDFKNELSARRLSLESYKSIKYLQQEDQENLAQGLVKAGSCSLKLKDLGRAQDYFGQALSQARDNQQIRVKLRDNKEQIQEYLKYIEKDKRAGRDATIKMQATELKEILVS